MHDVALKHSWRFNTVPTILYIQLRRIFGMPIPSRVLLEQSHAASPEFSLLDFFVALNEHRPLTGTDASLSISYPASTSWRFRSSYVSGLVVMRTVICIVRPLLCWCRKIRK